MTNICHSGKKKTEKNQYLPGLKGGGDRDEQIDGEQCNLQVNLQL